MTQVEAYEMHKQNLLSIEDSEVKTPTLPIDVFVDEALDLSVIANEDKQELTKAGFNATLIDELSSRALALRYAESVWNAEKDKLEAAGKQWNEQKDDAMDFKEEMVHDFLFAYRNEKDLLRKVREIAEGGSYPDMVQDLGDLAVLGKANPKPLQSIKFNLKKLDKADTLATQMGNLLATVNGERTHISEEKDLRDRAFTYLLDVVSEVRDYGKYVFWKDSKRLKLYSSSYLKKHRKNDYIIND